MADGDLNSGVFNGRMVFAGPHLQNSWRVLRRPESGRSCFPQRMQRAGPVRQLACDGKKLTFGRRCHGAPGSGGSRQPECLPRHPHVFRHAVTRSPSARTQFTPNICHQVSFTPENQDSKNEKADMPRKRRKMNDDGTAHGVGVDAVAGLSADTFFSGTAVGIAIAIAFGVAFIRPTRK